MTPHLVVVAGSRAYGIHRATSDVDLRGIGSAPGPTYHGFRRPLEQVSDAGTMGAFLGVLTPEERAAADAVGIEGTIYELRRYFALAAECNPNLLDVLFCRDDEVRVITPIGRALRDLRDAFLSRKARHTYAGYATAQLKRIDSHRRWLLNPPKAAPERAAFGLPAVGLLPADQIGAAEAAIRKQLDRWEVDAGELADAASIAWKERAARVLGEITVAAGESGPDETRWVAGARAVGLGDDLVDALRRERAWDAASRHWRQYCDWKRERNVARSSLEAKFGYDTKHAAHLVRLLRMGDTALRTGRIEVWRGPGGAGDAEELLAIRDGAWSYDDLMTWVRDQETSLDTAAAASPLPVTPDLDTLDTSCVELVERALAEG